MPEMLQEAERIAKKQHTCSYCGEPIEKGEVYEWAKMKYDGRFYEWKNHKRCGFIADQLWGFADPDDGMTQDDFMEACAEFCAHYICTECPYNQSFEYDGMECEKNLSYCIDKIGDFLRTHELHMSGTNRWGAAIWECRERKERVGWD